MSHRRFHHRPAHAKTRVQLSPEQIQAYRFRLMEIERQRHVLSALEGELKAYLSHAAGVDIEHERWELDVESGVMVRAEHTARQQ